MSSRDHASPQVETLFVPTAVGALRPALLTYGVRVEDGTLVARGADGERRVPVAEVVRALWLTPQLSSEAVGRALAPEDHRSGVAVLLGRQGPVLALPVADYFAGAGLEGDVQGVESSGIAAFLGALDLVVEPAGRDDVDAGAVRRVLVRARRHPNVRGMVSLALTVLAGVTGLLAAPASDGARGRGTPYVAVLLLGISVLTAAVVVGWLVREQRLFRGSVDAPPPPEDRVEYPPGVRGATRSRLQLGRTAVVAWAGGEERRLRGPATPGIGVDHCTVGPDYVVFADVRRRTLLSYQADDLCPEEQDRAQLRSACESVGIRYEETPAPQAARSFLFTGRWAFDASLEPDVLMGPTEDGAISFLTPLLLAVALLCQLIGGLASTGGLGETGSGERGWGALAWGAVLVTVVLAVALLWTHLSFTGWRRAVVRDNPRHVSTSTSAHLRHLMDTRVGVRGVRGGVADRRTEGEGRSAR